LDCCVDLFCVGGFLGCGEEQRGITGKESENLPGRVFGGNGGVGVTLLRPGACIGRLPQSLRSLRRRRCPWPSIDRVGSAFCPHVSFHAAKENNHDTTVAEGLFRGAEGGEGGIPLLISMVSWEVSEVR
jgi:hypothetical protein